MPFVTITKPLQGDATKKALIDAIIDDLTYLNSVLSSVRTLSIPNGSFELDTDADGIPDQWTRTLFSGGSTAIVSSGGNIGKYSFKFTSPGGGGNGGGYLDSADFFEVSPLRYVQVSWQLKSSVINIRNKVEIRWYDNALNFISAIAIYDNQVNNPTVWARMVSAAYPPATARYAKLRITGADSSNTNAGNVEYDDFQFNDAGLFLRQTVFDTAGTFTWKCPPGIYVARVKLIAGGGAGAGSAPLNQANGGGGGGGSGQYAESLVPVTPGTNYTIVVGAGAVPAGSGAGANSTFGTTTVIAAGGGPGQSGIAPGSQAGGPGGTGGTGQLLIDGNVGRSGVLNSPPWNGEAGAGADSVQGGRGGVGEDYIGRVFTNGISYGAGGGGGGGNGAAGRAIIEY